MPDLGRLAGKAAGSALNLAAQAAAARAARAITAKLNGKLLARVAKAAEIGRALGSFLSRDIRQVWLGGYSLSELEDIADTFAAYGGAIPKTWWHLQLYDPNPPDFIAPEAVLNLYAHSVSYQPWTIAGETIPIGSTSLDRPMGAEPVDLNFTSYDTFDSTLVRYFDGKARQLVTRGEHKAANGLVGYPADYTLILTITHAAQDEENKFAESFLVRPATLGRDLTRTDGGPQEIPMTFSQVLRFLPI